MDFLQSLQYFQLIPTEISVDCLLPTGSSFDRSSILYRHEAPQPAYRYHPSVPQRHPRKGQRPLQLKRNAPVDPQEFY